MLESVEESGLPDKPAAISEHRPGSSGSVDQALILERRPDPVAPACAAACQTHGPALMPDD